MSNYSQTSIFSSLIFTAQWTMGTFSVDAKDTGKGEGEKIERLADLVRFLSRELRFLDLAYEPFPLRYFEEK